MMVERPLPEDRLRHLQFQGIAPNRKSSGAAFTLPRPCRKPRHEAAAADPFLAWLLESAGLNAGHYRPESLTRRLGACLRAIHAPSVELARSTLCQHPELLHCVLNALLPGVTGFFRDPFVFEYLRQQAPSLAEAGSLRVWSAACADGQETYSVALLLAEAGLLQSSALLGTDCRMDAIAQARAGNYRAEVLQDMDPGLRSHYFSLQNGGFRIAQSIRDELEWKVADLFQAVESGPWDLILWRNHAIYLRPESAHTLWCRMAEVLRPGGLLVAGSAERPSRDLPFVQMVRCVFQRTSE